MSQHKIIVVDDDKEDHMILSDYFKEIGIDDKVLYFENGKIALNYLENIKQSDQLPDLVILDLNMPLLNGTQTLMQMKHAVHLKHIPVMIFSTSENETEKRKCLSLGAVDYLVKPTTYDEGLKIVNKFQAFLK